MCEEAITKDRRSCNNTGQNASTFPMQCQESQMVKYFYGVSAPWLSAVACSEDDLCMCCTVKDFIQVAGEKVVKHLIKMAQDREMKAGIKNSNLL